MTRRALVILLGLLAIGALSGCSNNPTKAALGTMNIQMTDAPGDFQAVNLVVNEVAVHASDGDGGWEILASQPHAYDLLQLRNGVFTTLGISLLPAGHYDQLRLKLGAGSTVTVDNLIHPLVVPSGLQSGYKLAGSFDVPVSGQTDLALDFDAARSIVLTGNSTYLLDPVARVVTLNVPGQEPGAIHGVVAPGDVATTVLVVQNADTVASSITSGDGSFTVGLLAAGTYRLVLRPWHDYLEQTLDGVVVNAGATTDIGVIELQAPAPPGAGAVTGQVVPSGVPTTVSAMQEGAVVGQSVVDGEGMFVIDPLPPGTYTLLFHPEYDFTDSTLEGVVVRSGTTTNVGQVSLQP